MNIGKRATGDLYLFSSIIFIYLESFRRAHLRKRVVGDLYLASSIPFIYLAFLNFGLEGKGLTFLVIGFVIAFFGMRTKKVMMERENLGIEKK
jgi:hypothetical protein